MTFDATRVNNACWAVFTWCHCSWRWNWLQPVTNNNESAVDKQKTFLFPFKVNRTVHWNSSWENTSDSGELAEELRPSPGSKVSVYTGLHLGGAQMERHSPPFARILSPLELVYTVWSVGTRLVMPSPPNSKLPVFNCQLLPPFDNFSDVYGVSITVDSFLAKPVSAYQQHTSSVSHLGIVL